MQARMISEADLSISITLRPKWSENCEIDTYFFAIIASPVGFGWGAPHFAWGVRPSIFDAERDSEERVDSGEVAWRISCPPSTVGIQGAAKHDPENS